MPESGVLVSERISRGLPGGSRSSIPPSSLGEHLMKEIGNLLLTVFISVSSVSFHSQPSNVNSISQATPPQVAMEIKRKWDEQTRLLDRDKLLKDYPGKKLDLLVKLL